LVVRTSSWGSHEWAYFSEACGRDCAAIEFGNGRIFLILCLFAREQHSLSTCAGTLAPSSHILSFPPRLLSASTLSSTMSDMLTRTSSTTFLIPQPQLQVLCRAATQSACIRLRAYVFFLSHIRVFKPRHACNPSCFAGSPGKPHPHIRPTEAESVYRCYAYTNGRTNRTLSRRAYAYGGANHLDGPFAVSCVGKASMIHYCAMQQGRNAINPTQTLFRCSLSRQRHAMS